MFFFSCCIFFGARRREKSCKAKIKRGKELFITMHGHHVRMWKTKWKWKKNFTVLIHIIAFSLALLACLFFLISFSFRRRKKNTTIKQEAFVNTLRVKKRITCICTHNRRRLLSISLSDTYTDARLLKVKTFGACKGFFFFEWRGPTLTLVALIKKDWRFVAGNFDDVTNFEFNLILLIKRCLESMM